MINKRYISFLLIIFIICSTILTANADSLTNNAKAVQNAYLSEADNTGIIPFLSGGFTNGIKDKQTISDVKSMFKNDITILNSEGKSMDESKYIGTGCIIKYYGYDYNVTIKGDVSGDGEVDSVDCLMIKKAIIGNLTLNAVQLKAACMGSSQELSSTDYLKVKKYFIGTLDLYPEPDINNPQITIEADNIKLAEGEKYQINTTVTPDNANIARPNFYSYDRGAITTVSPNGLISTVSAGYTKIEVTFESFSKIIEVTVSPNSHSKTEIGRINNGEYTYDKYSDHIEIIHYNGNATVVDIPSQIDGKDVTIINERAFPNDSNVTEITVPDTVTTIGSEAFLCMRLKKISIGKNVKYVGHDITNFSLIDANSNFIIIGDGVLLEYNGTQTSVTIPDNVKYIADRAFAYNNKITSVILDNGLQYIGNGAFCQCYSLGSVNFPEGLLYIGKDAFYQCNSIQSVLIPDSVTYIGDSAFSNCMYLSKVKLPTTLKVISGGLFLTCPNLTECDIPQGVTSIGRSAFNDAPVKNIKLPEGLRTIGEEAFTLNSFITDLVLPESLEEIGYRAFSYCNNLKNITFPKTWKDLNTDAFIGTAWDRDRYNNGFTVIGDGVLVGIGISNNEECIIPSGVKYISGNISFNSDYIKKIVFPEGVLEIGKNSFKDKRITEVVFPSTLKRIDDYAFNGISLVNLSLPDSLEYIGDGAFENTNCQNIKLPSKLKYIGYNAMYLTTINDLNIIGDGILYKYRSDNKTAIIPDNIKCIAGGAFECSEIISVVIPDSVNIIGNRAFYNSKKLQTVNLGTGLKRIEQGAFMDCTALTDIELPQGLEYIGASAFCNSSIKKITLPKSVVFISWAAFSTCQNLSDVTIEAGVKTIDSGAFLICPSLGSVYIPSGTSIIEGIQIWDRYTIIKTELGSEAFNYAKKFGIPIITV